MATYYKLIDRRPVPCKPEEWDALMEDRGHFVEVTQTDKYVVSTVFLGLDNRLGKNGQPLLFETMVFPIGSFTELYCDRTCTWEQAEDAHTEALWKVLAGEIEDE